MTDTLGVTMIPRRTVPLSDQDDRTRVPVVPLTRTFANGRELELVDEVLRSGRLHDGPMLRRFEERIAHVTGSAHTVATSSPVTALQLVAATSGWGIGDEVATSPFGAIGPSTIARVLGVTPAIVDIDPVTLGTDVNALAAAIGSRTRGVIAVDAFGWPTSPELLGTIARDHDVVLVQDVGGALGARSAAPITLISLDARSQVGVGSGAVLCTDDAALAQAWRELAASASIDCRLGDVAAAIGLAQLERLPRTIAMYELVADDYVRLLERVPGVEVPPVRSGDLARSWSRFWILLDDSEARDRVARQLSSSGVETEMPDPVEHGGASIATATGVAARALALPCWPQLSPQQQERIVATIHDAIEQ
ncbi:MAG: DegT/DnrJ/EryC1/StrS family aminotransferase [Thermoleophilia bacterium]|nr:DegT/DnrJ/EryC1/StrS family aminotransferase [Thermoleophilia bacterium]